MEYGFELVVLVGIHPQSTKSKYRRKNPHSRKHHCLQYRVFCGLDLCRMPCTKSEVRLANVCMMYSCRPCCFTLTVTVFICISWGFLFISFIAAISTMEHVHMKLPAVCSLGACLYAMQCRRNLSWRYYYPLVLSLWSMHARIMLPAVCNSAPFLYAVECRLNH